MRIISLAVACAALAGVSAQDHDGHSHGHGAGGVTFTDNTHYIHWDVSMAPFNDIDANVGEHIAFEYNSGSDIIAFKNAKNYKKCNVDKSMSLAKNNHGGGVGGTNLFKTELSQAGVLYLASSTGCAAGQKLVLTIKAPLECGAHSHDSRCAGSHSPHEDEEEAAPVCGPHSHDPRCPGYHAPHDDEPDAPDCSGHSHDPRCPGSHAPHEEEPDAPDCSGHSHDPRCPGSHSAAEHEAHMAKAQAQAASSTASSACFVPAIAAPSTPRAGAAAVKKSTSVTLVWAAPKSEHDSNRGDKYQVSYGTNSVETMDTTITITDLAPGSVHRFKVVAINAMGKSRALNIAVKTKKSKKGR